MTPFDNAALVVAAAAICVWLLRRLGQSSIVAYLLIGVAAGPHALDLVRSSDTVSHLAELGVVFLLFFIGLELEIRRFKRVARLATLGAAAQIAATTAPLAALARLAGLPWPEALAVGFCLAISSTTIVVQVFEDRDESDSHVALESLALAIGQDLATMAALALSVVFYGAGAAGHAGGGAARYWGLLALPVLFVVARRLLPRLFRAISLARQPEAFALASLAACIGVAALAQQLGASLALGAFLAGMVFADTPLEPQIRADLAPVKRLALGLFFVSIGMLVDLQIVAARWHVLLIGVAAVAVVKTLATALALRALRRPWSSAAGTGLALAQASEFTFVLASSAAGAHLLAPGTHALLVPLAVLSMLAAPLQVGFAVRFGQWISRSRATAVERRRDVRRARRDAASPPPEPKEPPPLAVVIGYGPVGRTLSRILLQLGVRVVVIDTNAATVEKLRQLGREAIYGDASQRAVLAAAHLTTARWLVLTLPDARSRAAILSTARLLQPRLTILCRARYLDERPTLESLGADAIAYEEAEVAVELARLLLRQLATPEEALEREVAAIRTEISVRTGFTMLHFPTKEQSPPSTTPGDGAPSVAADPKQGT